MDTSIIAHQAPAGMNTDALFSQAVVNVQADSDGFMLTLACGHEVWTPIQPEPDAVRKCSACVLGFIRERHILKG